MERGRKEKRDIYKLFILLAYDVVTFMHPEEFRKY